SAARHLERVPVAGLDEPADHAELSHRLRARRDRACGRISFHPGLDLFRSSKLMTQLDSKVPSGPLEQKWDKHKGEIKLVNPANKRKHTILVVGTGLAGASAAASLAELGYAVKVF